MPIIEGKNWCKVYDKPIEVELVKELNPPCIKENKGCGNCPQCTYRTFVDGEMIPGDTLSDSLQIITQVYNEIRDLTLKEIVRCHYGLP